MSYIRLKEVYKYYKSGDVIVNAVNGVTLDIDKGDFIAITGKSGCGKTTLLNLLGGLDKPTKGNILHDQKDLSGYKDLSEFRKKSIGFVFQFFNLIPIFTVEENICLPLLINGEKVSPDTLTDIMEKLGLKDKRLMFPSSLSGGEQQRVAIGRAIISKPDILLADEPTGNLDTQNTEKIMDLLSDMNREENQTIILVTHDSYVASRCNKNIFLCDGKIVDSKKI